MVPHQTTGLEGHLGNGVVMDIVYLGIIGLVVLLGLAVALYLLIFFLKKKQIETAKKRLEAEAKAAIRAADAERGFVPHGKNHTVKTGIDP